MVFKHLCFRKYSFSNDCRLLLKNIQKIYIDKQVVINNKMVIKSRENSFGAWAFLMGVVLAIIIGLSASKLIPIEKIDVYSPFIYSILVILGLIVGYMNVVGKESQTFMIAGTILVIVSKFGMDSVRESLIGIGIGDLVSSIFAALLTLFTPATIIVALKTVFSIAK